MKIKEHFQIQQNWFIKLKNEFKNPKLRDLKLTKIKPIGQIFFWLIKIWNLIQVSNGVQWKQIDLKFIFGIKMALIKFLN